MVIGSFRNLPKSDALLITANQGWTLTLTRSPLESKIGFGGKCKMSINEEYLPDQESYFLQFGK